MLTFQEWYNQVDAEFEKRLGLDRDSFPDQNYYDMWEDGFSPVEAVAQSIENEYGFDVACAMGFEEYL